MVIPHRSRIFDLGSVVQEFNESLTTFVLFSKSLREKLMNWLLPAPVGPKTTTQTLLHDMLACFVWKKGYFSLYIKF